MRNFPSHLWKMLSAQDGATAFVIPAGGPGAGPMSHKDWMARVVRLAIGLLDQGLEPGDRVGLIVPWSVSAMTFCAAVWIAGGVVVPLDPEADQSPLLRALARSGTAWIVVEDDTARARITRDKTLPAHLEWFCLAEDSKLGSVNLAQMMEKGKYRSLRGGDTLLIKRAFDLGLHDPMLILYPAPLGPDPHGAVFTGQAFASQMETLHHELSLPTPSILGLSHTLPAHPLALWVLWSALLEGHALSLPLLGGPHDMASTTVQLIQAPALSELIAHAPGAAGDQAGGPKTLLERLESLAAGGLAARWAASTLGPKVKTVLILDGLPSPQDQRVWEMLETAHLHALSLWGLPETGPTHMERPGSSRQGSLGRPLYGVSTKIQDAKESAPRGRLMVRSQGVFDSYWDGSGPCEKLEDWVLTPVEGVIAQGYLMPELGDGPHEAS